MFGAKSANYSRAFRTFGAKSAENPPRRGFLT
jgi:hypothetical protein